MYWNNGDRYEGDFKNDKPEGKGIVYYKNGDRYEGDFKNGTSDGKGIYYHKNGDIYEGDYKNGKREGKGIYYYHNGDRQMGIVLMILWKEKEYSFIIMEIDMKVILKMAYMKEKKLKEKKYMI